MTIEELKEFVKREHERMVALCTGEETKDKRTLFRTIKLMEELGEVCEEVLGFSCTQRKEKMREKDKEKLGEELSDVLIVLLLLAENMEVDVFSALKEKIKKIEKRYET